MNTGLQNQDIFYELDSLLKSTDQAQIFINPDTFYEDRTMALQSFNFSSDEKTFYYSVSDAGSDWSTFYFTDIGSRPKLDYVIAMHAKLIVGTRNRRDAKNELIRKRPKRTLLQNTITQNTITLVSSTSLSDDLTSPRSET